MYVKYILFQRPQPTTSIIFWIRTLEVLQFTIELTNQYVLRTLGNLAEQHWLENYERAFRIPDILRNFLKGVKWSSHNGVYKAWSLLQYYVVLKGKMSSTFEIVYVFVIRVKQYHKRSRSEKYGYKVYNK
jgi:hypothetical protein